jgi:hypothetical protein
MSSYSEKKSKIRFDEMLEIGEKVHDKDTLENFIVFDIMNTANYGWLYIVQDPTNRTSRKAFLPGDLVSGWMSKENRIQRKKEKASRKAAKNSTSAAGSGASTSSAKSKAKENSECYEKLKSHGIQSLSDYRRWSSKGGHPNKGGNKELFQEISACVDKTFKKKKNAQHGGKKTRKNRKEI